MKINLHVAILFCLSFVSPGLAQQTNPQSAKPLPVTQIDKTKRSDKPLQGINAKKPGISPDENQMVNEIMQLRKQIGGFHGLLGPDNDPKNQKEFNRLMRTELKKLAHENRSSPQATQAINQRVSSGERVRQASYEFSVATQSVDSIVQSLKSSAIQLELRAIEMEKQMKFDEADAFRNDAASIRNVYRRMLFSRK